jgi:hypothetical protein
MTGGPAGEPASMTTCAAAAGERHPRRRVGTDVAPFGAMTFKNLFILGGALAGAAYLKDKTRRDRFMGQARGFIDQVKSRASEIAGQVQAKGSEAIDSVSNRTPDYGSSSSFDRSSYESSRTY